jgi:hypothetical protein
VQAKSHPIQSLLSFSILNSQIKRSISHPARQTKTQRHGMMIDVQRKTQKIPECNLLLFSLMTAGMQNLNLNLNLCLPPSLPFSSLARFLGRG